MRTEFRSSGAKFRCCLQAPPPWIVLSWKHLAWLESCFMFYMFDLKQIYTFHILYSRRSTMSSVGFSWWPRCSEVSTSDIRPSSLRCLRPPNLELSPAQDQTIAWQYIAFQTETESASVSAVLSASVDPYLMKGLISFLYYYTTIIQ